MKAIKKQIPFLWCIDYPFSECLGCYFILDNSELVLFIGVTQYCESISQIYLN